MKTKSAGFCEQLVLQVKIIEYSTVVVDACRTK
jgi:hypothetical protein